jgi:succinoglycan biosynthesis protein ExoM
MRVAVCIPTYQRLAGLRRTLEGLSKLTFDKVEAPALEIIVVDNDPAGSARTLCEEMRSDLRWPLKYGIALRRGVGPVRNKGIELATGSADFIAFVDDDRVPEPFWLDEFLHVQQSYGADVVCGRVLTSYEASTPDWIRRGRFFEVPRPPGATTTGDLIKFVDGGNALVRMEVFDKMGMFNEDWGLTPGEDTHFYWRAYRSGYKMVWADNALVREYIPKRRANAKGIARHAYGRGYSATLCELDLRPPLAVWLVRTAKAGGRIVQGLLLIPLTLILGRHVFFKGLQYICRGAGIFSALVGIRYREL